MILYVNIEYEWFFIQIYIYTNFFKKCLIKREQKILEV